MRTKYNKTPNGFYTLVAFAAQIKQFRYVVWVQRLWIMHYENGGPVHEPPDSHHVSVSTPLIANDSAPFVGGDHAIIAGLRKT